MMSKAWLAMREQQPSSSRGLPAGSISACVSAAGNVTVLPVGAGMPSGATTRRFAESSKEVFDQGGGALRSVIGFRTSLR
jgi:hypothetical protein